MPTTFTYVAVTRVSPPRGSAAGGREVVITGFGFDVATYVKFGGTSVPTFTIVSNTQIRCTTPEHASGVVDVEVGGVTTGEGLFTYILPSSIKLPPPPVLASPEGQQMVNWFTEVKRRIETGGSQVFAETIIGVLGVSNIPTLPWSKIEDTPLPEDRLPDSGVTPGTYGSALIVVQLVIDAHGRIRTATEVPTGQGLTLLAELSASASASLDFPDLLTSDGDDYLIEFLDLRPATNGASLQILVSTDNGATYDSGTNYATAYNRWSKTAASQAGAASDSSIDLGGGLGVSNDATEQGLSGSVRFHNPLGASGWKKLTGQTTFWYNGTPELVGATLAGAYKSATAVDAFQVKASSGNLASGTVRLYRMEQ